MLESGAKSPRGHEMGLQVHGGLHYQAGCTDKMVSGQFVQERGNMKGPECR